MNTSQDPLFAAIAQAVDLVMQRGIEVKPMADGFYIRIASQEVADGHAVTPGVQGRAW